jgi:hypothetical protein
VVLWLGHNHAIHQRTGKQHMPRIQRAGLGDPLHLHDHNAAGIFHRHRHGQAVEVERFPLRRYVAFRIGRCAAQERHVDRQGAVEQPLPPFDFHDANKIFRGPLVQLATSDAGIDKSADADARNRSRLAGRNVAIEMHDDTEWQVVSLDLFISDVLHDLRLQARNRGKNPGKFRLGKLL